jgi:hypothetical protein
MPSQYNWLSTVFYISYLIFEWPQTIALQRLPVAKWMAMNIFVWGIALSNLALAATFREASSTGIIATQLATQPASISADFSSAGSF